MKQFITKYRKVLLVALLLLVFINFYSYRPLLEEINQPNKYKDLYDKLFSGLIPLRVFNKLIIGGFSFFILSFFNALLSACVLFVYFYADPSIVKLGVGILATYWVATILVGSVAYLAGWNALFITTKQAISILPSPLIEASLIPILKLYQNSKQVNPEGVA